MIQEFPSRTIKKAAPYLGKYVTSELLSVGKERNTTCPYTTVNPKTMLCVICGLGPETHVKL